MDDKNLILRPKKIRGEDGYKTFSIRVKEATVAQIDQIAARTGYSRNELISRFLAYAIDHCAIQED